MYSFEKGFYQKSFTHLQKQVWSHKFDEKRRIFEAFKLGMPKISVEMHPLWGRTPKNKFCECLNSHVYFEFTIQLEKCIDLIKWTGIVKESLKLFTHKTTNRDTEKDAGLIRQI